MSLRIMGEPAIRLLGDPRCRGLIGEAAWRFTPPPRPTTRRARGGLAGVASTALLMLLCPACQDPRISLTELTERTMMPTTAPAVPVVHTELALTDFQPYRIGAGDVLVLRLVGLNENRYAETMIQARVHTSGQIHLPIVGAVKVAGLTLGEAEEAIIDAHVPDVVKDLAVYVELQTAESTTVLVRGGVLQPGLVKLRRNERNPLYAVATAGGFASTGARAIRVRPIRPEHEDRLYDLTDVNDIRRALQAPPLESGDVVTVEAEETPAVYVSGLVNRPGPILMPAESSLSLVRAISAAGGLREPLIVREATLVRALPDGEQVHVKLALDDILHGRVADVSLRPGDVLQIPHTIDTLFQEWFIQNVTAGPFNVGLRYDPLAQYNAERAIDDETLSRSIRDSLGSTLPGLLVPPVPTTAP